MMGDPLFWQIPPPVVPTLAHLQSAHDLLDFFRPHISHYIDILM